MPDPDPPEIDEALTKKKSTAQAAFTRTFNAIQRLTRTATPASVLETSFEELQKKYTKFEEQCENILEVIDEKSAKFQEISDVIDQKYQLLIDVKTQIAVVKDEEAKAADSTLELIKSFKASMSIPKPEVRKFDGSSKDYSKFISYIETHIEPSIDNSTQRLSILIDSCSGLAYDSIASLIQCKDSAKAFVQGKQILKDLFGSKFQITRSVVEECTSGQGIRANDIKGLKQLVVSLTQAEITLTENDATEELVSTDKLVKIYNRLPRHLQHRWNKEVVEIQEKNKKPEFRDLRKVIEFFIKSQDNEYAASSSSNYHSNVRSQEQKKPVRQVYSTSASDSKKCILCQKEHYLNQCEQFQRKSVKDRNDFVLSNKLCRNCLHSGHIANKCVRNSLCKKCTIKHNDLLHDPDFRSQNSQQNSMPSSSEFTATQSSGSNVGISCVEVCVEGRDAIFKVKAIVDSKSTCNLCTNRLAEKLRLPTDKFNTNLNVATGKFNIEGVKVKETKVYAKDMNDFVVARDVLAIDKIPMSLDSLFTNKDVSCFSHLKGVSVPYCSSSDEIDLLIGSGVPKAFHQLEERKGHDDEIYAVRQVLGWNLVGPKRTSHVSGSHSYSQSNESTFFISEPCNSQSLRDDIQKVFESDFKDGALFDVKRGMSVDDRKAQEFVESSLEVVDGQCCVGIPWKEDPGNLPSSKEIVSKRLMCLKKRMQKDKLFHKSYKDEMQKYIDKGYIETSDGSDTDLCHYIPHHPVWHPRKGTIRVVWDCALSLNDSIYEGPDLLNSLVDILIRFRRFKYVVCSDIRKMYLSVKVPPSDRGAMRILWWPDGDFNSDPDEYRATVHMYGARSSGFVANYCVKMLADEVSDPKVAEVVKKEFYVDDQVSSFETLKDASVVQDVKDVLKKGGFELTKFVSNSQVFMSAIPEGDRVESMDTVFGDAKYQHSVLGVSWEVNADVLKCSSSLPNKDEVPTCRSVLSAVAKVYDPLGVVSPVILPLRVMLQEKCSLGWDDTDDDLAHVWQQFCEVMSLVLSLKIPRCFKPDSFAQVTHISLHGFCDASNKGYAAAVYIRQIDANEKVSVMFVLGKSRVAPKFKGHIPQATIPKLELNAAAVLTKLMEKVKSCIGLHIDEIVYWCDSLAVLSCIHSSEKRFPVYWANRLAVIHAHSKDLEWRFVPTHDNPADVGSRGIQVKKFSQNMNVWINGPVFLSKESSLWPERKNVDPMQEVTLMTGGQEADDGLLGAIIRFCSCLAKLLRIIARLLRFMKTPKFNERKNLNCDDIESASMALIKFDQRSLDVSSIKKLKPVKDEYGIFRVSSRLCQAKHLSYDMKCPIILPKNSHLTRLIIDHEHKQSAHMGPKHVLTRLRQRFWVINGLKSVKSVIAKCRKCKEENARPLQQQMSLLPEERIKPSFPFQVVGLDYFGPFLCKLGRKRFKRYGCIFVCLATRAVHLECVNSLESAAFLCALSRFISRRGIPDLIFSDNATNFRGAQEELKDVIIRNNESVTPFLNAKGIKWHFHPPHGSHHGGHYERLIRSVRRVLRGLTNEQEMTEDNLVTFLCEAEKILNDRPLSAISDNPNDELPLTPNIVLLLRENSCMPLFSDCENSPKAYHRQAQYLAGIFWKRWLKEYLQSLHVRQKWLQPKRNLKVGDIVLMTDEGCARGNWPLARVVEVFPDSDNMVRKVMVKDKLGLKMRPISKLVLLEASE